MLEFRDFLQKIVHGNAKFYKTVGLKKTQKSYTLLKKRFLNQGNKAKSRKVMHLNATLLL